MAHFTEPLIGIDRLRYLPLAQDGQAWLSLGGEYRLKVEELHSPNFGIPPAGTSFTATGQRWFVHADIHHVDGERMFLQLSAADDSGRRPTERPFDRSGVDVAQAFFDLPFTSPEAAATLRVGRQELDLGGTRLVSAREAANLRMAFDMAHLELRTGTLAAAAFWGHPVLNKPQAFDDSTSTAETFFGLTGQVRTALLGSTVTIDVLALGRNRDLATYLDASGPEHRKTFAIQLAGEAGQMDFGAHASWQTGHTGNAVIAAYGVAASAGFRMPSFPWSPRLGVDVGLASGDRVRGDRRLNTFDPIYPNLGYFTDAPVDYPSNWQGIQPSLSVSPRSDLTIRGGIDARWRNSSSDALYATNTRAFVGRDSSQSDFVDILLFTHATWRATQRLQIEAGYVHGTAKSVIARHGGRAFDYSQFLATYKF